jgi:hypothetical protein
MKYLRFAWRMLKYLNAFACEVGEEEGQPLQYAWQSAIYKVDFPDDEPPPCME